MRLLGAEFGSTRVFEPILDHNPIVDIGGSPNVASAVSNPVALTINKQLKFNAPMRSLSFSPSARLTNGRTRDLFDFPSESRSSLAIITFRCAHRPVSD